MELWGTQSPADFVSPSKEEIVVREDPLPWGWNQFFDENGMPPPPPPRLGLCNTLIVCGCWPVYSSAPLRVLVCALACYLLPSFLLTHPHAYTNKRSHTRACVREIAADLHTHMKQGQHIMWIVPPNTRSGKGRHT